MGGAWNPTKLPFCLLGSEVVSVLFPSRERGLLADAVWAAVVGRGRWTPPPPVVPGGHQTQLKLLARSCDLTRAKSLRVRQANPQIVASARCVYGTAAGCGVASPPSHRDVSSLAPPLAVATDRRECPVAPATSYCSCEIQRGERAEADESTPAPNHDRHSRVQQRLPHVHVCKLTRLKVRARFCVR